MPIKIEFREKFSKLYTYSCVFDEKTIIHGDWLPLVVGWGSRPNPENYIFGDEHREEAALYLGFAWNLSQSLDHFVIPRYYRDDAAKSAELPFEFIKWEYQVDLDHAKGLLIDKGFIPAHACVQVSPPPSTWQKQHRHEAGLFHIQTFAELGKLHQAILTDATSEINIFSLKSGRSKDLLAFLTDSTQPDLSEFLVEDEIFIDIMLGIDMGYQDSILIKSPQDIGTKVRTLSLQYELAVSTYEYDSFQSQTLETALVRLNQLAEGKTKKPS